MVKIVYISTQPKTLYVKTLDENCISITVIYKLKFPLIFPEDFIKLENATDITDVPELQLVSGQDIFDSSTGTVSQLSLDEIIKNELKKNNVKIAVLDL